MSAREEVTVSIEELSTPRSPLCARRSRRTSPTTSSSERRLSISVDGRNVVDLWGGHLDAARTRPWQRDSLVCIFSCTKGVVAIATMWAVERGLLDLDRPVASYWPEFAAEGKGDIPVRWLLTHEAGLPAIGTRMPFGSLSDWEAMVAALAAQAPSWEPGSGHGYHGVTFGHLVRRGAAPRHRRTVGELVPRRARPRRSGSIC